jgi:hypothetical protein
MPFTNRNVCKTFNLALNGTPQQLANQECSQVTVCSTGGVTVFDRSNPAVGFSVPLSTVFTFMGVSNSSELSASGSGTLSYRTQYFSGMQQTFV